MAVEIGDSVIYTDEYRQEHPALVTQVWSHPHFGDEPGLNLVYISPSEDETDQYGRQIKRPTSVPHKDGQPSPGRFWE